MAKSRADNQFGDWLRRCRVERGYTLLQVAEAAAGIPPDTGEPVSDSYLSVLETGRQTNPSIGKLLSLAAVYGISIQEFISRVPESNRDRLRKELHDRWASRDVITDPPALGVPKPLDRYYEALDPAIDATARDVSLPIGEEAAWRSVYRTMLLRTVLAAITGQPSSRLSKSFWRERSEQAALANDSAGQPRTAWKRIVAAFIDWAVQGSVTADHVAGIIDYWSADAKARRATCHFGDAEADRRFGFDDVPISLATDVRSNQIAQALHAAAPKRIELPPAPGVSDAVADRVRTLLALNHIANIYTGFGGPLGELIVLASELLSAFPEAFDAGAAERHRTTIDLLKRAATDAAAES